MHMAATMISPAQDDELDLVRCVKAIAAGDYSQLPDGDGPLVEAIRDLGQTLQARALDQLKRTVTLSARASDSMAATSFVTGDVRETAQNAQTIAAAVEELTVSMRLISETGTFIADTARAVDQAAHRSLQAVGEASETVHALAEIERQAMERIGRLVTTSQEIGKIVGTIQAIAKQTNLLALNASIEAARAGEAGRGFSIVAGEVKHLANLTAKATDDIRRQITAIQNEVKEIRDALAATGHQAEAGLGSVGRARTEVSTIVSNIRDLDDKLATHASSLTEQAAATQEVSRSVAVITDRAERTRINAEAAVDAVANSEEVIQDQFAELASQDIPNAVLYLAKSDHMLWKKRLAQMLVGKAGLAESEVTDHHSCRLGKWYDGDASRCYHGLAAFRDLEAPHARVHTAARDVVRLFNAGERVTAMEEFRKLEAASDAVVAGLDALGDGQF